MIHRILLATLLLPITFALTGCLETAEDFEPAPQYPSLQKSAQTKTSEISHQTVGQHLGEVLAAIADTPEPTGVSDILLSINSGNSNLAGKVDFSQAIQAYNDALAAIDQKPETLAEVYMEEVYEVSYSKVYSALGKYDKLEEIVDEISTDIPQGMTEWERDAIVYNIKVEQLMLALSNQTLGKSEVDVWTVLLDVFEIGDKKIVKAIKAIFDFLGLSTTAADSIFGLSKCETAAISFILSVVSCATGNIFSCFSLPFKLKKWVTCNKEDVKPWDCTMSPDPCCG
ncbi:MAG: hypothetical protein AAGA31_01820, partial [Bacteroidota bacterium]